MSFLKKKINQKSEFIVNIYTDHKQESILKFIKTKVPQPCLAENFCFEICKRLNLKWLSFPLYGLCYLEEKTFKWLLPSDQVSLDPKTSSNLWFRARFFPSIEGILKMSHRKKEYYNDIDYLFLQIRSDFFNSRLNFTSEMNLSLQVGFCVLDKARYLKKTNSNDGKKKNIQDFIPSSVINHFDIIQKQNLKSEFEEKINNYKQERHDETSIKSDYISGLMEKVERFYSEEFVFFNGLEKEKEVTVVVQPHHPERAGICIKNHKGLYYFRIEDLMSIELVKENPNLIRIHRKNGTPHIIPYDDKYKALSLIHYLNCYYRLTYDYNHFLNDSVNSKIYNDLKISQSHGPVELQWAKRRLEEKQETDDQVNYLLQLCPQTLGDFRIVFREKPGSPFICLEIVKGEDKKYNLKSNLTFEEEEEEEEDKKQINGKENEIIDEEMEKEKIKNNCIDDNDKNNENLAFISSFNSGHHGNKKNLEKKISFDSPIELINFYKKKIKLKRFVKPSPPCDLLICLLSKKKFQQEKIFFPQNDKILFFKTAKQISNLGSGMFTNVSKATIQPGDFQEVALKFLKEEHKDKMEFFLQALNEVVFWKKNSNLIIIKSVSFYPPSLAMEFSPFGDLRFFLKSSNNCINLFIFAENLANAVFFLHDDLHVTHGNIKCGNLLVFKTSNYFSVKLSDPGMGFYYLNQIDYFRDFSGKPWLAPELLMAGKKYPTQSSDIFACGTTLWEIFSFGKNPNSVENIEIEEDESYFLPKPQECPDILHKMMIRCWHGNPAERCNVKDLLKEIRNISSKDFHSKNSPLKRGITQMNNYHSNPGGRGGCDQPESISGEPILNGDFHGDSCNSDTPLLESPCPSQDSQGSMVTNQTLLTYGISTNIEPVEFNLKELLDDASLFDVDNIPEEKFYFNESNPLGEGHYGKVYKGDYYMNDGKFMHVAVKVLKKQTCEKYFKEFEEEYKIMKGLRHPKIVTLIGRFRRDLESPQILLLEFMDLGSLKDYLKRPSVNHNLLLDFGFDIAKGMEYMASKKIVHRDLAARNILVGSGKPRDRVKIGDFGLSRILSKEKDYYTSDGNKELPILWSAPEIFEYNKSTEKSDVWSYGVTLWEMFSGGENPSFCNVKDLYKNLHAGERLKRTGNFPVGIMNFIKDHCWSFYSQERSTFKQILIDYPEMKNKILNNN